MWLSRRNPSPRDQANRTKTTLVNALPQELLCLVIGFVYQSPGYCGRTYNLLPASTVCKAFRRAALPLLFETLSAVVRDKDGQRAHPYLGKLLEHTELLKNVRTLRLRAPLHETILTQDPADVDRRRCADLDAIERALHFMQQLNSIR